jgi:hypothetical protein
VTGRRKDIAYFLWLLKVDWGESEPVQETVIELSVV